MNVRREIEAAVTSALRGEPAVADHTAAARRVTTLLRSQPHLLECWLDAMEARAFAEWVERYIVGISGQPLMC